MDIEVANEQEEITLNWQISWRQELDENPDFVTYEEKDELEWKWNQLSTKIRYKFSEVPEGILSNLIKLSGLFQAERLRIKESGEKFNDAIRPWVEPELGIGFYLKDNSKRVQMTQLKLDISNGWNGKGFSTPAEESTTDIVALNPPIWVPRAVGENPTPTVPAIPPVTTTTPSASTPAGLPPRRGTR